MKIKTKVKFLCVALLLCLCSIVAFNFSLNTTVNAVEPSGPFLDDNWSDYADGAYAGGSGGPASPFQIETAGQLAYMASRINSGSDANSYFVLTEDLDLTDHYWTPIGKASNSFSGSFDGQGHKIEGIYVGNPTIPENADLQYAGLFGNLTGSPAISNLSIEIFIQNSYSADSYVGGIAGYIAGGTITDCFVTGDIIASSNGKLSIGGLAGYGGAATLTHCVNEATVQGTGNPLRFGGLIGESTNPKVYFSCNNGELFANASSYNVYAGGLVGYATQTATINNSFNSGNLDVSGSGTSYVGGLIGFANAINLHNCFVTGDISLTGAAYTVGGIIAYISSNNNSMSNCFVAGDITIQANNNTHLGGLIGYFSNNSLKWNNCYVASDVTLTWNNGNNHSQGNIAGGGKFGTDGADNTHDKDFMQSEDFLDLLNSYNSPGDPEWIEGDDGYPTIGGVLPDSTIYFYITFDYDDGSGRQTTVRQPKTGNNANCELPEDPVREGYSFGGWFSESDGEGYQITALIKIDDLIDDDELTIDTFYAYWEQSNTVYVFNVTLFDTDDNPISDPEAISALISTASFSFDENANVGSIIRGRSNSDYRFLNFEINGQEISLNHAADYFSQYADDEPILIGSVTTWTINVSAIYVEQVTLSFLPENNTSLVNGDESLAMVFITIDGQIIVGFFEDRIFDKGTNVLVEVFTASGYTVQSINTGLEFSLDANISIEIVLETGSVSVKFEVNEDMPSWLMPYFAGRTPNESGLYDFSSHEGGLTILVPQSLDYLLMSYEVYHKDGEDSVLKGSLAKDSQGMVEDLSISDLLYEESDAEVIIIAVYKPIISLNFIYVNNSTAEMGMAEVYKENDKIELDIYGRNLDEINAGDNITIKLVPKIGYEYVNAHEFTGGIREIEMAFGQGSIEIEFAAIDYNLSVGNTNSKVNKNTAKINENIVISMDAGFGFEVADFTIKIEGQSTEIDAKYVTVAGNSLIINFDEEFIETYGIDSGVDFNLDFTTKMSVLFIVGIGGSAALIIVGAILLILFLIANKKRKAQLMKAEEETRIGMAKLSAADTIKNLREE